jgi:hypothetical protein
VVTAAAVLLILGGGLAILFGLLGLGRAPVFAVISMAVGALQLYAGVQVLNLREVGRRIGLGLAIVSLVLAVLFLARGLGGSVISIVIDAFIIYALTQYRGHFSS